MKRLFCISIVLLHLLNVVGCYWLFSALQNQSKAKLAEQLDIDSYAGSQAITIKLPVSHFEGSNLSNYERVDGEFEYEGVTYRMVKQKFYQDTAYIVCYKDERTIEIKNALKDYVDTFTDAPSEKKSESKSGLSLVKDYLQNEQAVAPVPVNAINIKNNTNYLSHYPHLFHFSIDYPPKLVS